MRISSIIAATALLSLTAAGAVHAADAKMPAGVHVKEVKVGDKGVKVLADAKGMTLYTFDNDMAPGKSACNGQCAQFWPPLMAAATDKDAGQWTVVTRDDGSKQWAFKGKPLYTFVKDTAVGDFNGNDQPKDKPVWHCALPG